MRRLWAYIITAVTALVLVGTTFVSVFVKSQFNIEYSNGTEMTFRVTNVDENGEDIGMGEEKGADYIAEKMIERLDIYKVSNYKVETQNQDTVKVTLKSYSEEELEHIRTYLSFNGSLGLSNAHNTVLTTSDNDDNPSFLPSGEQAIMKTTSNGYPSVVLPVDVENSYYKQMLQETEDDLADDSKKSEFGEATSSQGDDGEEVTEYHCYFYLWYDYDDEKCTFDALKEKKESATSRLLMKFEITPESEDEDGNKTSFYYDDGEYNKLYSMVNMDRDSSGDIDLSEKEYGYNQARYIVNLINAGELDYKVTYLYSKSASAWNETLVNEGGLSFSKTFIAMIAALIILAFILVAFYRLSTLSIVVNAVVSIFAAIGATILFNAEFTTFAVAALIAVAFASLTSSIIYMHKMKEEAYRGRSLKKANSEASRRSLLPIVDVNVVLMIIGIFCYVLGGQAMRTFAVVTVFGGLASLLLNVTLLKGMMWLATNATCLQGKYEVFGINGEHVPNLAKEEKQTYYGAYADKNFTKKKKPIGIVFAALFVASLVGGIVFGAINKGQIYAQGSKVGNSQIYFETTNEYSGLTEEADVREVLEQISFYEKDEEDAKKLSDVVSSLEKKDTWSEPNPDDEDNPIEHYTFLVTLDGSYDPASYKGIYTHDNKVEKFASLEETIEYVVSDRFDDETDSISMKVTKTYSNDSPVAWPAALATLVGVTVAGFYLVLRYRLSRGLGAYILALASATFMWGFFALVRLPVTSYTLAFVPVVGVFAFALAIAIMNKERDMILEEKVRDNSSEHRAELLNKSNSLVFSLTLSSFIFIFWLAIDFFGFGPIVTSWMFLALAISSIVTFIAVTTLLVPISNFFYAKFKLDNIERKRKPRKNKKPVRANKGAEPEEAIFIGIND